MHQSTVHRRMDRRWVGLTLTVAVVLGSAACGSKGGGSATPGSGGSVGVGGSVGTGGSVSADDLSTGDDFAADGSTGGAGAGTGAGGSTGPAIVTTLPAGFTAAEPALQGQDASFEPKGGFQVVGPLADVGVQPQAECTNILRVLMRDFISFTHPDFGGLKQPSDATGMVEMTLGSDRKPVRTTVYPDVATLMNEWYNSSPTVSVDYVVDMWLEPTGGLYVFDSSRFFPLDAVRAATEEAYEDMDGTLRNFGFTTELHTRFKYRGGEVFNFRGDDDVFVYVDGKLAVDLGGVHNRLEGSIDLDSLGLTVGSVYTFDLFQAERNPVGSNFRLETSLDFTECGEIIPGVIK